MFVTLQSEAGTMKCNVTNPKERKVEEVIGKLKTAEDGGKSKICVCGSVWLIYAP